MAPRVVILHHARSFHPMEVFQQVGGTVELIWALDGPLALDAKLRRVLSHLGAVVDLTGRSPQDQAGLLASYRPEGIASFVDDHLVAGAHLAEALGLAYHRPAMVGGLVDKRTQRAVLARAGIPGPRFWPMPAGLSGRPLAGVAQQVSYPAVLKPAEGSGSRGIYLVRGPAELVALVEGGASSGECPQGTGGHLVEEYLPDEMAGEDRWMASYVSLESVVSRGRPSHVALTGRFPLAPPFRETGNFIPGILPDHLWEPVKAIVEGAVEALEITDAVIHTEVKLTPEGPKLIEVNGRLGGRPPFVLESVSPVNLFQTTMQVALGHPVVFEEMAPCSQVGFWLMLQPPMSARRLVHLEGIETIKRLAGVDQVAVGRRVGEPVDWRLGTGSWVLTVRGRASDHKELTATVARIGQQARIGYELEEEDLLAKGATPHDRLATTSGSSPSLLEPASL